MAHHAMRQVQGFCVISRKNLALEQRIKRQKALAFKAFCVVQYALYYIAPLVNGIFGGVLS